MMTPYATKNILVYAFAFQLCLLPAGLSFCQAQQPGSNAVQGELKFEGKFIQLVVLVDKSNCRQNFDTPGKTLHLPPGEYFVQQIHLTGGYLAFFPDRDDRNSVVITADKPAVVKLGGPLKPILTVERRGAILKLDYQLLGIGDEKYSYSGAKLSQPSFTVYQSDKQIASGSFEFG